MTRKPKDHHWMAAVCEVNMRGELVDGAASVCARWLVLFPTNFTVSLTTKPHASSPWQPTSALMLSGETTGRAGRNYGRAGSDWSARRNGGRPWRTPRFFTLCHPHIAHLLLRHLCLAWQLGTIIIITSVT